MMFTIHRINLQFQRIILRDVANKFSNSLRSNKLMISAKCLNQRKDNEISDKNIHPSPKENSPFSTLEKYKIFKDEDSPVILDIVEERFKALQQDVEPVDEFDGLNLQRGREGVFDIEDIVELLRREKAINIFVVKIPEDLKYVDYVVIVSGKSVRHMKALAEFVRRMFKQKRNSSDRIPILEGEDSRDWMAIDLGNIALHIFSEDARVVYDLESLWSIGSEYDELSQQPEDPLVELLQKHSVYLGDLQPANTKE